MKCLLIVLVRETSRSDQTSWPSFQLTCFWCKSWLVETITQNPDQMHILWWQWTWQCKTFKSFPLPGACDAMCRLLLVYRNRCEIDHDESTRHCLCGSTA